MTDIGTELTRAATLPTFLPRQRQTLPGQRSRPGRSGKQTTPVSETVTRDASTTPGTTLVAPAPEVSRPATEAPAPLTAPQVERPLVMAADLAAGAMAALVDWRLGVVTVALTLPVTGFMGLHRRRFALSVLDEAPRLLRATAAVGALLTIVALVAGIAMPAVLAAASATLAGLIVFRTVAYARIRSLRRTGRSTHPVVLVGPASQDIVRRVAAHPEIGLDVVGTADAHGRVRLAEGGTATVGAVLDRYSVRDVILDPCGDPGVMSTWVRNLSWRELSVYVVQPQVGATPVHGWDDHVWGVPLMRMRSILRWRRMRSMKRLTDVAVGGLALVALAPLLGLVALLVRREVGSPLIFRQERVGLDGHTFDVLKFRSMRNLPPGQQSPWTVDASDRIGPVGRFIRKFSIDELPQLWNVVRGDMSLVGPRPERPEYVREFSATYPSYEARHRAPVGLTGLAAVEGLRGDTSIEDRAYFDNLYVDSWTFWGDLKIVARTVLAVLRGTGS